MSPGELTEAIKVTLAEYIVSGDVTCAYEIGDGFCEDFANDVLAKFGIDALAELESAKTGIGPYTIGSDEFWSDTFYMDLTALRDIGEPIPDDLPADRVASLLGTATHIWIHMGGKHYDAMNPEGVEHFLQLSFFAAQLDGLRKELAAP